VWDGPGLSAPRVRSTARTACASRCPLSDDPNDEKPVTFAYDTCVRVAKLADNVLEMGVRAPPVGWERLVLPARCPRRPVDQD
jgi:hypothetical protein